MLSLESLHFLLPNNLIEYRSDKCGRFGWFLCTWHPDNDVILEEIQAEIKLELLNSGIDRVSRLEVESWLKRFFGDYHWKLHALLKKTTLNEKGMSLLLGIIYDHEIFFVQFGRLVVAVVDKKGIKPMGRNWKNFHVKSMDEMSLLGGVEDEIKVKPVRIILHEHERLAVLTVKLAQTLLPQVKDPEMLNALAESYTSEPDTLFFILEAKEKLISPKHRKLKRFQISGIVLILLALLSIAYMMWGNRFIETSSNKLGIQFHKHRIATLDQVPDILRSSSSNILKQIFAQPARNITFHIGWQTDLQYEITATPVFSSDNIYLVSRNIVAAYNLRNKQLIWKKQMDTDVHSLLLTDGNTGNLLIIEENKHSQYHSDTGQAIWQVQLDEQHHSISRNNPMVLANRDDARLDGNITVIPQENGISIYDSQRGELITSITFNDTLLFLSDYDRFRECFYAVVGKGLYCVELKIRN